jgi:NADP-dependent aldehyde dehydrogenase
MKITGHMLIGQDGGSGTTGAFNAFSPALAADIEPAFGRRRPR